jgi:flagellar biosynthesis/type III secretory pathway protein FliH
LWSKVLKPDGVAWVPPIPPELLPAPEAPGESPEAAYQRGFADGEASLRERLLPLVEQRLAELAAQVRELAEHLDGQVRQEAERFRAEVLELALAVAERVVAGELGNPDAFRRRVEDVLRRHPAGTFTRLLVGPAHAPGPDPALAELGLEVMLAPELDACSFYLEGERERLDASLTTAFQEIRDAL